MNPQDIGKMLVNAHEEITSLKRKLDGISGQTKTDTRETQQIFQRLNYTIKKFENSIQNNVDRVLTHNMTNVDSVPQSAKFPQILNKATQGQQSSRQGIAQKQTYAPILEQEHEPFYLRQQKRYQRQIGSMGGSIVTSKLSLNNSTSNASRNSEFQLHKLANKSFEMGRVIIQSAAKPQSQTVSEYPKRQKSASVHQASGFNGTESRVVGRSSERNNGKLKAGRISKAASVLPAEIRNNPFADPIAITESEIYCGIYNLINQGIVPKDVDIMPAFARGVPPLLNKPARMHEFKDKLIKQEVNIDIPMDLLSLKLDILPSSLKNDNNYHADVPEVHPIKYHSLQQDRKPIKMKSFMPIGSNDIDPKPYTSQNGAELKRSTFEMIEGIPKSYPEVLDTYSLHHLVIRKGKVLEETPEFASYKRIFGIQWGSINQLFKEYEVIAAQFSISMFSVDGKKLALLSEKMTKPTLNELLSCIVNHHLIPELQRIPGRLYLGEQGRTKAIVKIQGLVRGFLQRCEYQRVQKTIATVKIIQKYLRLWLKRRETKAIIQAKNQQQRDNFSLTIASFKADWPEIRLKPRFEIHINSFSFDVNKHISALTIMPQHTTPSNQEMKRLTMDKQLQRENIQITRIFNIRDPMVSIIYVCPFDLSDDITNYYYKILELGEVVNFKERLFFIKPENCDKLPQHLSLSKKLLYSPGALRRVRRLIKNKSAYMVPGYPSNEDIKLATELQIPIMGGDPQASFVNSTKSASRRIFHASGIEVPVGAFEIYDEQEFVNTLTILVTNNPETRTWIFKIDDEFQGRGIAYLNIDAIPSLLDILSSIEDSAVNQNIISRIKAIVVHHLPSKIQIAIPTLYRDYKEFLAAFLKRGGIIEAYPTPEHRSLPVLTPSISFFIEPTGEVNVISTFDKISGNPFINIASSFPQNSIPPHIDLYEITTTLAKTLYSKGVFGFVTADFLSVGEHLYGIGIDCFMNNYLSSFFYFDYLMRGTLDQHTGKYRVSLNDQIIPSNSSRQSREQPVERTYLYCPFVHHPGLVNVKIKNFFQMCRYEAIQFDLEKKFGATFLLVDVLQAGGLGLLTIGENEQVSLNLMNHALGFLMKQAGPVSKNYGESIAGSRTDCVSIADVISRIRVLVKKSSKRSTPNSNIPSNSRTPITN